MIPRLHSWLYIINRTFRLMLPILCPFFLCAQQSGTKEGQALHQASLVPLYWINTAFENASPMNWTRDSSGVVWGSLVYDRERNSTNQANSHWHFQVQGRKGDTIPFVLQNFDNIWNGHHASPISKRSNSYVSADGCHWERIGTELLEGQRLKFFVPMSSYQMYVASVPPYTQKNLNQLLEFVTKHKKVSISSIGKTVEGRPLEIIRVGNPDAPYRIFIRARAHGFEAGETGWSKA